MAVLEAEGDAPIQAIWQLSEDVHAIAAVHAMVRTGTPLASAIRNARVWGKRQNALERAVQRVAPAALPPLLLALARLDALAKGLGRGDAWSELADAALALCGKPLFAPA
jgi:DNA polymerase-3 subunit delta